MPGNDDLTTLNYVLNGVDLNTISSRPYTYTTTTTPISSSNWNIDCSGISMWNTSKERDDIKDAVTEEMDKVAVKIYNLVKELVELNVTEEDFLKLLHETD